MSNYLKSILAVAVSGFLANSAMAADGTINFTGEIIAASCSATAGSGTTVGGSKGSQTVDVKLGKVSIDSLSGTAGGGIVAGVPINLDLDCGGTAEGLTTVKVQFDPASGSGYDLKKNTLLKTTGTATGVGIGIYDANNKLLNLAANEVIKGTLDKQTITVEGKETAKYTAKLNMRGAYVANGDTIAAGTANGTLPFTLMYE